MSSGVHGGHQHWGPHTVTPYAWMVWGQEIVSYDPQAGPAEMLPFSPRVRLHAARYADVRYTQHHGYKWGNGTIEVTTSIPDSDLYVIEGEHWRGVLESLYRKWAPSPTGDLYH